MTTQRQIKKLVAPLLERHDDLAICGSWLMLKPVHHVLRGVIIASTSSADWFQPAWAITNFCDPTGRYQLNWGDRLYPRQDAYWRWSDPRMPDALFEIIEDDILRMLRPVKTLDDIETFLDEPQSRPMSFDWDLLRLLPLLVARGDLDRACAVIATLDSGTTHWSEERLADERVAIVEPLREPLTRDDRNELARVLRGWEEMRIAKLKMQAIWEPTPFPLETV